MGARCGKNDVVLPTVIFISRTPSKDSSTKTVNFISPENCYSDIYHNSIKCKEQDDALLAFIEKQTKSKQNINCAK